jgi:hypothetical protein
MEEVFMATPGQLVRAMSEVLGISAGTVAQYDRQLAEAGLRSVSGRGSSAAKVTAGDAANLLIALLGEGSSIRAASQTCKKYGSLGFDSEVSDKRGFEKLGLMSLASLPERHTFRRALTAFIDAVGNKGETIHGGRDVWVQATTAVPSAGIYADPQNRAALEYGILLSDFKKDPDVFERHKQQDLWQMRRVSFRTIQVLGDLVASTGPKR